MLKNVQGIKKFLLYRLLKDAETKAGIKIALQTEHEVTSSRELNTEATKDGAIVAMGAIEQEISATVFLSHSDEIDQFKEAQEQGWLVELWDVIAEEPDENGEYKATYYQAYVSEIGETAPTDEGVEVSITFGVEDYGKRGRTPLTAEQEKVFRYVFVKVLAGTTQEKAIAELANQPGTTTPTEPVTKDADKYAPSVTNLTTTVGVVPEASTAISNLSDFAGASVAWEVEPDVSVAGDVQANAVVTYSDASKDTVVVTITVQ